VDKGAIRQYISQLSFLYKAADAAIIWLALYFSLHIYNYFFDQFYVNLGLLGTTVFLIVAESHHLYRSWRSILFRNQASTTFVVWLTTVLILLVVAYLLKVSGNYSRIIVLNWCSLTLLFLISWRFFFRRLLGIARRNYFNSRSAAIIGVNGPALDLAKEFLTEPEHGIRFLGYFDDRQPSRLKEKVPVAGKVETLIEMARAGEVDNIYISLPLSAEERTLDILDKLSDTTVTVSILPNFLVYSLLHSRLNSIGKTLTLSVHDTPIQGLDEYLKRMEDLMLFVLIFPFIVMPLLAIALCVKCTSPGPVIFRQKRYGLDGRKFEVLKFRTMTTLDDGEHIKQATINDERVTGVGRILRKYSLDELPQVFNVLAGSMSFVGPRPHAVAHNEAFRKIIRGYMLRHKVKPGITGWAQVNGLRGETETVEKMKMRLDYDLEYIQRWSIATDLKILYLTLINSRKIIASAY
jgi:putative colanic acid biosynthesis UDP-glucose lipid carrier transferase